MGKNPKVILIPSSKLPRNSLSTIARAPMLMIPIWHCTGFLSWPVCHQVKVRCLRFSRSRVVTLCTCVLSNCVAVLHSIYSAQCRPRVGCKQVLRRPGSLLSVSGFCRSVSSSICHKDNFYANMVLCKTSNIQRNQMDVS